MKVLAIPDIHLKRWIFDCAEEIMKSGRADRAVCLMDIPDDWNKEYDIECYRDTYDRAIEFAKEYPDTLWCLGNHDVSYPWGKLESGYSPYAEQTVISKLEELSEALPDAAQLAIIHRIDNVIFSHGGLSREFVYYMKDKIFSSDIDEILYVINNFSPDYLWNDYSPLWLRPQDSSIEAYKKEIYTQVVGHTPVKEIYEDNGFISTDVFSTSRFGAQIGESAMLVIDSITREYEKVEI